MRKSNILGAALLSSAIGATGCSATPTPTKTQTVTVPSNKNGSHFDKEAGAKHVPTNPVYDPEVFRSHLNVIEDADTAFESMAVCTAYTVNFGNMVREIEKNQLPTCQSLHLLRQQTADALALCRLAPEAKGQAFVKNDKNLEQTITLFDRTIVGKLQHMADKSKKQNQQCFNPGTLNHQDTPRTYEELVSTLINCNASTAGVIHMDIAVATKLHLTIVPKSCRTYHAIAAAKHKNITTCTVFASGKDRILISPAEKKELDQKGANEVDARIKTLHKQISDIMEDHPECFSSKVSH